MGDEVVAKSKFRVRKSAVGNFIHGLQHLVEQLTYELKMLKPLIHNQTSLEYITVTCYV